MLLTAIIFVLVSVIIVFGLVTPIIKQIALGKDIWNAKQGYFLSEAGAEDVLYRLKNATYSQYIGSTESITLGGYSATTTFSGSVNGLNGMTMTTLSNDSGYQKKVETKLKSGDGASFTYGVQVGTGGIILKSGTITGNVYSGGDIVAQQETAKITGSAVVYNGITVEDQSNDQPTSSPNSITFGNAAATQDFAQSFQVSTTTALTEVSLYLKKTGSPSSVTVKIVKNSGGSPSANSGDVVSSASLNSSLVTTSFDWVDIALSPNPSLVVGNTYWIVIDGSTGSASNDYTIGANLDTNYALGTGKTGSLGGSWSNTGYDAYFRLYLGGGFGTISGIDQYDPIYVGTTGSDMAWAHNARYVNSTGPIRCQNDTLNNKACDSSYDDPSPVGWPISNGNITDWESDAISGGVINGNETLSGGTTLSLGPTEIKGNLYVTGGSTLNMTGTLYVTGTVTIDGGSKIQLASSYGTNSGVIIANGVVSISGGGHANGSGQTGSYLMILTTSNCMGGSTCSGSYAVSVSGGSGAVILNAQNGAMDLTGGVSINEATANQLIIEGGSNVTYQTGLASPTFSSGPSGGYSITDWRELSN